MAALIKIRYYTLLSDLFDTDYWIQISIVFGENIPVFIQSSFFLFSLKFIRCT